MAVTLNGTWSPRTVTSGSGVTTVTETAETVAAGTNTALGAVISWEGTTSAITLQWDSAGTPQSMTQVSTISPATTAKAQIWGLLAPTVGNKNLKALWTTARTVRLNSIVLDNVLQTSIATAFTNSNTGTGAGTKPTLTVTTSSGDASISCVVNDSFNLGTIASPAVNIHAVNGSSDSHGASYLLSTSTSDVHSWSGALAGQWGQCGIRVNQAVATGPTTAQLAPLMAPVGYMVGPQLVM